MATALIDVTDTARDAGIRVPTEISPRVRDLLEPAHNDPGLDYLSRLWELLARLRSRQCAASHSPGPDFEVSGARECPELRFEVLIRRGHRPPRAYRFKALSNGMRITVLMEDE